MEMLSVSSHEPLELGAERSDALQAALIGCVCGVGVNVQDDEDASGAGMALAVDLDSSCGVESPASDARRALHRSAQDALARITGEMDSDLVLRVMLLSKPGKKRPRAPASRTAKRSLRGPRPGSRADFQARRL
jgi:hypothetical protein